MARELQSGSPWKYCLEISELGPGRLVAGMSLTEAKWVWPTVGISLGVSVLLGLASFAAFHGGKVGGGITAGLFACLALAVALFAVGCASYFVQLIVDEESAFFGRRFFWISRETKLSRSSLGELKCWSHSTGSSSARTLALHVCLHPPPPLPALSLFSVEYRADQARAFGEMRGMSMNALSAAEARQIVQAKADEIATCLGMDEPTSD